MSEHDSVEKEVLYCVGRTCSLTGLCIQTHEELKLFFREDEIGTSPCMHECKKAGTFSIKGHVFTAAHLDHLGQIIADLEKLPDSASQNGTMEV